MNDGKIDKNELIKYLNEIVDAEIAKSNEMDTDLIDECVDCVRKLKGAEKLTEEEVKRRVKSIRAKHYASKKRLLRFTYSAAALLLIFVLFNIQTVMAFISGLFFVPGTSVKNEPIIYYGIEGPIDIETEYGLLTLKFANKITINGKIDLSLYLQSYDICSWGENEDDSLIISITANGEKIVSDKVLASGKNWSDTGEKSSASYIYSHANFPDVDEFYLTVLGAKTQISLKSQPGNFALSQENNGITFAGYKFSGVTDMLAFDVFDNSESAEDYHLWGRAASREFKCYGENGEEINISGGRGGFSPDNLFNYQTVEFYRNESAIKSLKASELNITYRRNEWLPVEIPVPEDGETIKTDITIQVGSHMYTITEIRRENGRIYYKDSAHPIIAWDEDKSEYRRKVANKEAYIVEMLFAREDWATNKMRMGDGEIWDFDENEKTLTFYFYWAEVIQFGDFSIEF